MKSSDTITASALAVLLVGDPKGGKSSVMLGFPDLAVFDWDLNLASAVRRTKTVTTPAGVTFDLCQPAVGANGTKVEDNQQWKAFIAELLPALKTPKYKTIALDGLGVMSGALCEHIIAESKSSGSNKTGKMELQNYAELSRILRSTIMTIRASGKNLVITCHQTADKDEVTQAMRYFLAIPGQSKDTLPGWLTDCWAVVKKPKGISDEMYELRTRADIKCVPGLGASFEFPAKGALDITGKSPQEIWKAIEPAILAK